MCQARAYSTRAYCALPLPDPSDLPYSEKRASSPKLSFNRLNIEGCFEVLFHNINHFLFKNNNKAFFKFVIEPLFDLNNDFCSKMIFELFFFDLYYSIFDSL